MQSRPVNQTNTSGHNTKLAIQQVLKFPGANEKQPNKYYFNKKNYDKYLLSMKEVIFLLHYTVK